MVDPIYNPKRVVDFGIYYYISSLCPQYFILITAFVLENFETKFPPNIHVFTLKKFTFISLIIIFVMSLYCLYKVNTYMNSLQEYINIYISYDVKLSYRINPGIGEFFLNILVPIILSLPSINLPFSSFVIIILIQISTYLFYSSSTDVFPNLSLWFIHYNIYKIRNPNKVNKAIYILGKTERSKAAFYGGKDVKVVPINAKNSESSFAVISNIVDRSN